MSSYFIAKFGLACLYLLSAAAAPIRLDRRAPATEDTLFPMGRGLESWSTLSGAADALPLSDDTLRPTKVGSQKYTYEEVQGQTALVVNFDQGAYRLKDDPLGGVSFYATGPIDLTTAKEATFGYSIMFPNGFAFNKGGKLPGLYGGNDPSLAASCSGGRRDIRCFSARLMWRTDGAGEVYTYLPPGFEANEEACKKPEWECNSTYGASVGRGRFDFPPGQWVTVAERVKLNDPGQSNGEIELFVDGKSVISETGLVLVDETGEGSMQGIQVQVFFGGSTADWASPKDQKLYISAFSGTIISHKSGGDSDESSKKSTMKSTKKSRSERMVKSRMESH
ncbi:hypothetical protein BDQ17DRAFT_1242637 [Cyathus striatus]|nr:hypothetical protein BDQ17DRAFT_1242637 [Cyathus striatus]